MCEHPKVANRVFLQISSKQPSNAHPVAMQLPVAEYLSSLVPCGGVWRIWIHYRNDMCAGSYLELHPDGAAYRITEQPDGTISDYTLIKEAQRA